MNKDMEHHKSNQYPVHPLWQLRLGQFYGEEDGHNCKKQQIIVKERNIFSASRRFYTFAEP